MKRVGLLVVAFCLIFAGPARGVCTSPAGSNGDYSTKATGNWNATSTWQTCTASVWVAATSTPTNTSAGLITIQSPHTVTVTADVTVDQLTVDGDLEINTGVTLTIDTGPNADLTVDAGGTTAGLGTLATLNGTQVEIDGALTVQTVNTTGGVNTGALVTVGSGGQWTVPSSGSATVLGVTVNSGGLATWNGPVTDGNNAMILNGTVTASANVSVGNATNNLQIGGTVTITAGTISVTRGQGASAGSISSGGSLILQGSSILAVSAAGSVNSWFEVLSGGKLDIGPNAFVNGLGFLQVDSGANLKIGSTAGIVDGTTTVGNVRTGATDSYSTGANYTYDGTAAQVTGSGLPATVNTLTISNTGGNEVTLSSSLTVTGALSVNTAGASFDQNACTTTHTLTVGRMVLTNGGNYINCNSSSGGGTSASTLTFNGSAPELSVGSGSTLDYVGTGTITFASGANVSNSGAIRINGGARSSGIPDCNSAKVTITSSSTNIWSGGNFYLGDLTLTNQAYSPANPGVTVFGSCSGCTGTSGDGFTLNANCTNAVTLVSFHSFSAVPQGGGVLLKWRSGREVSNLGYHVYRDGVRITRSPIAGSALLARAGTVLTAGNSYSWFDAEGTSSSTYTIEDVDLNGLRTVRGLFYVDTAAGSGLMRSGGAVAETGSRTISELGRAGSSDSRWFTTSALESTSGVEVAAAAPITSSQTSQQYTLAAGQAVKLGVRQEGWYHVDASQLTAAGMPASVNPRTVQLFVNGQQQDILVAEQGGQVSAVEFYGTGVDTTWSDTEVYWLRWGSQNGQRIQSQSGKGKGTAPTSFPLTVQWKPRVLGFPALINGDADNYFGPALDAADPVTQSLPVTNLSAGTPGNSTLQVRMQGVTAGTHVVGIQLNGNSLGSVTFQDEQSGVSSFSVANASLAAGAALTLTALGGGSDVTLVDTVTLTYPHKYAADGDALRLTAPSGPQVTITGFSNSQIRVMDVTDPANVTAPQGTVALQPDGSYSVMVVPKGGGTRTLLAFTNAQMSEPASVEANQPSSWHLAQAGADMVIISHGDFIASLAPLVALRQSQGLKVAVVNVEDLYDEFNFGVLSPYAMKSFLSNARTVWTRKPRWVLLVGDATIDPRDYLGQHQEDYVPVELVGTTQLETASDDWFGDFNNDGIPEMFVGRLPVHAVSDAAALVAKIVAYDNAGAAPWKSKALLAAGTNDSDNNFESQIAAVQALLPSMTVTDILQGSDPNAAADFLAAFNGGQGLVNFTGHGSTEIWKGDLFTSAAAGTVANGAATPFVISMTCLNGYFADMFTFSLAEAVLEAPGGGAVGVWASSGLTESPAQATMNQAMIRALYGGGSITVGEAAVVAKRAISDPDVQKTWILFADPAMKLR